MKAIESRSEQVERLLVGVETAHGSGDYRVDARLRVDEVWQRSDRSFSTATLSVRVDDEFDSEEARRRYHPDCRLAVMTDEPVTSDRSILFEGYPPAQSSGWDGRIGREDERYVFEAEHAFERLARAREAMVYGRRVRSGGIDDGLVVDPDGYADKSVLMTALPCVFNPDGEPNRAATPLTTRLPAGEDRLIHLFTSEGQLTAQKWTYGTVLRYLIWFYLMREGPVFEGNVFSVTDSVAAGAGTESDPLNEALGREPVSLTCEATSLAEALSLLAAAAGIHITAETVNEMGRPVTQLRVWSSEGGPTRQLYLARGGKYPDGTPRYDASMKSAREVLAANNTYRGQVTWDHRGIVNNPVVIGDVKRYEMTVPLWPGWIPRSNLDDVPAQDRATAKSIALTPAEVEALGDAAEGSSWFRQYHRRGSEFKLHSDVSRLWILNEDGYYEGGAYNRNAPFDDYRPFDFSTVADSTVTVAGGWMRRRRLLLPTISTSPDGRKLGVWVEISFDSGVNWQQQAGGVRAIEDRIGVYLDCENPTEITPVGTDPAGQNLWYAIIDQTFRVRVTAVIESDERMLATFPAGELASPTLQINAMVVRRPKSFQFVSRSHTTNALASVTSGWPVERDDTKEITALAERLARANQDRQVRVAPTIPWIETHYAIGDRITEIRGRHLRFATVMDGESRWPAVIGRRFVLREGRYETELALGITGVPGEAV